MGLPRQVDARPGRDRCCSCCLLSFKLLINLTLTLPPTFSTLAHIVFVGFCFDQWLLKCLFYWSSLLFSGLLNALRDCTSEDHTRALKTYVDFVLCQK